VKNNGEAKEQDATGKVSSCHPKAGTHFCGQGNKKEGDGYDERLEKENSICIESGNGFAGIDIFACTE
jgi:hypothetical protein